MRDRKNPFTLITHSVKVSVLPTYLPHQSSPTNNLYVWAYHIVIENQGAQTVQLLSRYWRITDALGRVQEVRGGGVVGEQPTLHPGTKFEYTSCVTLPLPSGVMTGSYFLKNPSDEAIEIKIPLFSLDSPAALRTLH